MKLWIDATTPAPDDCLWCKGLDDSIEMIQFCERLQKYTFDRKMLELIDISYDSKVYTELINWLKETGRNYPIRIHSMNPVGVENMRRIIQRNGWTEVK